MKCLGAGKKLEKIKLKRGGIPHSHLTFFPSIAFVLAVYDLTHSPPSGAGGSGGGVPLSGYHKTPLFRNASQQFCHRL